MNDQARTDGLRLLRAARAVYIEQYGGSAEESFKARTTLDPVAAGQRTNLPTGFDRHNATVVWLESNGAIEPDPMYQNIVGGPIYRITARGLEMVGEGRQQGERMSQEFSYDVYVKIGVDGAGEDVYGDAIPHFMEERNALEYKRQLEARGKTMHIQKAAISGFSDAAKEAWFDDYNWEDY